MKKHLAFLVLNCASCFVHSAFCQSPLIKMWDHVYGGNETEIFNSFIQTEDRGFLLGGSSSSGVSGDKTQPNRGVVGSTCDFWIVKLDSFGLKKWDKRFGGSENDAIYCVASTSDHGYILGGLSKSDISGDKSENNWDITGSSYDYWLVKIDSTGNKQWDKRFGGIDNEIFSSVQETKDGGYLIGGTSVSGNTGDKSQASWGNTDFWIVKTDALGTKLWDKRYGWVGIDNLASVHEEDDGGFILTGASTSGIGGDKTQPSVGSYDYWILKIDSLGNKLWDKNFGGNLQDHLTSSLKTFDNGLLSGGNSWSGISGDKTEPGWGLGDYWIVKTDSLGNKLWDKNFGGNSFDVLHNIATTKDKGFLIAGMSESTQSGNKTENNMGFSQTWIVKMDSAGGFQWDKTVLIPGLNNIQKAIESTDGCVVIGNLINSGIGGYQSESPRGQEDYWIIKFCDSTLLLQTDAAADNQLLCPGTCTDFLNLSIYATGYQWNFPGATPDTSTATNPTGICYAIPGSYDVQLIATNANMSDTLLLSNYINVFPIPPPQGITQYGDTLLAIAGSAFYQWFFNGNTINGATDYFYIAIASGDYNVIATDSNGCEVEAVSNNVVASIQYTVGGKQLTIYPNPVIDKFTIQKSQVTSETAEGISVYNMIGEKIFLDVDLESMTVNCRPLGTGIYYLELVTKEKSFRSKFVKQ